VNKLLDHLLARQARLMDSLGPERSAVALKPAPLSREELERRRVEEAAAIESASKCLGTGDIAAAAACLEPHVDTARDTRTLTTLAWIQSAWGNFDAALELLQRAERINPVDEDVLGFAAEILQRIGRHSEAIHFRRRIAFATAEPPASACAALIETITRASHSSETPLVAEVRYALAKFRSAPDANNTLTKKVAQSIYSLAALRSEARDLYEGADPRSDGEVDVELRWGRLHRWAKHSGARLVVSQEGGAPGRRPMMAELTDVLVEPRMQWMPFVSAGSIAFPRLASRRLLTRVEDPASPLLMNAPTQALVRQPVALPVQPGPALLVGGAGSYSEDLLMYCGTLAIAETLGVPAGSMPLVVNAGLAPHQTELLDLLGYPQDMLLALATDRPAKFSKLSVVSRPVLVDWVDPLLPAWYRRRLAPDASLDRATRRVLVVPSDNADRRLSNADEAAATLRSIGFTTFDPSRSTVREQIEVFSQAREVVVAAGAALANLVFTPVGARVVVLQDPQSARRRDGRPHPLMEACGHSVRTLECAAAHWNSGQGPEEADLHVDVQALLQLLTE
jgi:tetratricopeptide (TPR) repeat protein